MKSFVSTILDIIFPRSKDELAIAGKTADEFLAKSTPRTLKNSITVLASYKDVEIRAAIHLLKFHHHTHALSLLCPLLEHALRTLPQKEYILIPIPLSSKRLRERGFNQVEVLARASIKNLPSFSIDAYALAKTRHTKPQSSLGRKERLANVKGAYTLRMGARKKLAGKHLILLDDVCTTSSTLLEAKKVLTSAEPSSLTLIALAH